MTHFRKLHDRLQASLFFVPMLFVVGSVVVGQLMLVLDERVDDLPESLTATVESARGVLTVVAGATLAFAGIAFSVSLLLISLASSQYSPRVVHGLFRDPFNKRVMGVVIGTFTYCLVVLRAVRGPLEDSGTPVVPSVSILLAVVLGIVSVLSIVGFISHNAHSMDVSKILHRVAEESLEHIRATWLESDRRADDVSLESPSGEGYPVTFDEQGWIQQIDHRQLLDSVEPGTCIRVESIAGRYAIPNTPLCTIWPTPVDGDETSRAVRASVVIGETRTMQQDVTYGVRQLVDVALKALSPGINDPTTAQDAMFHLGSVMRELLVRTPPSRRIDDQQDRRLLLPETTTHHDIVGLAFDEVRLASVTQPTFQIYLLEILHLLDTSLDGMGPTPATRALARQADLIVDGCSGTDLPEPDRMRVMEAHRHRFSR